MTDRLIEKWKWNLNRTMKMNRAVSIIEHDESNRTRWVESNKMNRIEQDTFWLKFEMVHCKHFDKMTFSHETEICNYLLITLPWITKWRYEGLKGWNYHGTKLNGWHDGWRYNCVDTKIKLTGMTEWKAAIKLKKSTNYVWRDVMKGSN